MLKFILDIFCNDTITGLSQIQDTEEHGLYKNCFSELFQDNCFKISKPNFTDPIVYHL